MAEVDEKRLHRLLGQGKSQREIAQALKISRSTLQRIIKQLDTSPAKVGTTAPSPQYPIVDAAVGTPPVDMSKLKPAELEAVRADFWEMIDWWRARKARIVNQSTPRDTTRQTYHVERRFVELIRHEAETESVNITEVVNRAFKMYFEKK
jgi:AraC-like DNA-binding protein